MGRVYAVVSAKGGVGKTTTTTNLAAALAAAGADVAVVDGDLGMANLAGALGVVPTEPTLHDVLAGESDVSEATQEGPHGMAVVPGATDLDAFARADPEGLRAVLSELADRYEYVLLDTGAGLSNDTVVPLTYVDEAILVSTTGRDALGDTEKTRQVAVRLDVPVAGAVLTRVDPENPNAATVEEQLDAEILQAIPDENVVRRAGDAGEPLTTFAPGSSAAAAYRALAADLTGEPVPQPDAVAAPDEPSEEAPAGVPAADDGDERPDASADETGGEGERRESIIVAGDHEADADADEDADANEDADAETDEPLVADAEPEDAPSERSANADDGSEADEPLVESAEPDAEEDPQIPFASDDGDANDEDGTDEDETDDEEDEDSGIFTTELGESADGAEKRGDDDEKKGLFGRFLG